MMHSEEMKKLPITAYLNSKHGLLYSKSSKTLVDLKELRDVKDLKELKDLRIHTLESQVKANNQLTLRNSDDLKKSRLVLDNLTQRLDSCSCQVDQLTLENNTVMQSVQDLKRGQKRKWEDIDLVFKDVDEELSSFQDKIQDLEISISNLNVKLQEIQNEQGKNKRQWIKSAAVGASAAIVVLSTLILSPDIS